MTTEDQAPQTAQTAQETTNTNTSASATTTTTTFENGPVHLDTRDESGSLVGHYLDWAEHVLGIRQHGLVLNDALLHKESTSVLEAVAAIKAHLVGIEEYLAHVLLPNTNSDTASTATVETVPDTTSKE